jgi:hypothetical protein
MEFNIPVAWTTSSLTPAVTSGFGIGPMDDERQVPQVELIPETLPVGGLQIQ